MKFKINEKEWEIIETSQEEMKSELKKHYEEPIQNGRYYGITFPDNQIIYIDKDLHIERKKTTLIHELSHCYIVTYITHQDKNYNEEDVCDILANSHYIIHNIVEDYFKDK